MAHMDHKLAAEELSSFVVHSYRKAAGSATVTKMVCCLLEDLGLVMVGTGWAALCNGRETVGLLNLYLALAVWTGSLAVEVACPDCAMGLQVDQSWKDRL